MNPTDGVDVSLASFGGIFTDMDAACLPSGGSPDSQDVCFLPGDAFTRPAFKRLYANGFVSDVTWCDSFTLDNGLKLNIFLTLDGSLWKEEPANLPGSFLNFGSVPAGSKCKAVPAFGRIYFAFSDGVHGTDHAWQYDGTNFDRVSQDGPALAIGISSVSLPAVSMSSTPIRIDGIDSITAVTRRVSRSVTLHVLQVVLTAPDAALAIGQFVTIAGNSEVTFNIGGEVVGLSADLTTFDIRGGSLTAGPGTGGTATFASNAIQRFNNTVTAHTATPHGLQVGYQAQISGVEALQIGGGIVSIVIDNENQPGIATVTTAAPHGLLPQSQVNIRGVNGAAVGGGILSAVRMADITTVTTNAAHSLSAGSVVMIAGSDPSVNGQQVVAAVPTTTTFVFTQADSDATYGAGGTVTTVWPVGTLPATQRPLSLGETFITNLVKNQTSSSTSGSTGVTQSPNYFSVQTVPTPTTFTMDFNYVDGTWTGGTITFGWNGTFYVASVPSSTSFTYLQYGPNIISAGTGTVTPWGQAEPGLRSAVLLFQTRNGFITAAGPAVQFFSNGGQYISVGSLAIGPPNVTKRIVAITGANGSTYRYLGISPFVNNQLVGTATVIPDNVTTTAVFDFGDDSLLSGTAIDIPGNNAFAQVTLGPVCGVEHYADRMFYYGEDNRVQNFVNMGFDGGYLAGSTVPPGWIFSGTVTLRNAVNGGQYLSMSNGSSISQTAYQTAMGVNILDPTQTYKFKAKITGSGTVTARLSSASTGAYLTATLPATGPWAYGSALFQGAMPSVIPSDMLLTISATGTVDVDEMAVIFAKSPYNENQGRASYVINPEAFDGITGTWGPSADTSKIQSTFKIRSTLYINTRERLHAMKDLDEKEPSAWSVDEQADNCGAVSLYGLAISKTKSASGRNWASWASDSGAMIFGGSEVRKISQDIQAIWDTVNQDALTSIVALNDQDSKRLYFAVPTGNSTIPSLTIPLDYRHMESSDEIAERHPIRTTLGGNIIAPDLCRKWTKWTGPNLTMGYVFKGQTLTLVFSGSGKRNVYYLDPNFYTDDDYGQIMAYHVGSPFASDDDEQRLQLGHHRHLYAYLTGLIAGIGNLQVTPYADSLENPWPSLMPYELNNPATYDAEMPLQVSATKMFLKISVTPIQLPADPTRTPRNPKYTNGTDTFFDISRLTITMRQHPMSPVRGRV